MAKISADTVKKVARLANLRFSADQFKDYTKKFASVVDYVEKLNSLDTSGVEPTSHVLSGEGKIEPLKNTRDDNTGRFAGVDDILKNAPERAGRLIKVPKVID